MHGKNKWERAIKTDLPPGRGMPQLTYVKGASSQGCGAAYICAGWNVPLLKAFLFWLLLLLLFFLTCIYLVALGLGCGMRTLVCGMWDLVP